jgi:hypothetical protein
MRQSQRNATVSQHKITQHIYSSSMSDQAQIVPQILTRSALQRLSSDLDAGDVLECYLLSRSTPLHGLVNSTISVTKQALGLRYRPPQGAESSGGVYAEKEALELTLEYGPMRMGVTLQHESIPRVVRETELSGETAYVSWKTEGKVYYTTSSISSVSHRELPGRVLTERY